MSNPDQPKTSGRITRGPLTDDNLVPKTLEFVRKQLPNWRDDPKRSKSESEKSLNSTLCDFLEHRRRDLLPMARFKHESPWRDSEQLTKPQSASENDTHCLKSEHPRFRPSGQVPIELHHYWIVMVGSS